MNSIGEIAIGHGVERVRAKRLEAELRRDALAVDREARARERRASQRQPVHPPAAVAKALGVAREHRFVGEQMVAESDGLRDLQMRVARA